MLHPSFYSVYAVIDVDQEKGGEKRKEKSENFRFSRRKDCFTRYGARLINRRGWNQHDGPTSMLLREISQECLSGGNKT